MSERPTFYEFFAGGGMARAGLGEGWHCTFANDFDPMKAATYAANWGSDHLVCGDVAALNTQALAGHADLAWASFPCQDLSLAGDYRGLGNAGSNAMTRSGTFWPFWSLIRDLLRESRAPRLIVLENVLGVLTSRKGRDFAAIGEALSAAGYRFGAVVVDAKRFLPQSRPRVFIIAVTADYEIPAELALPVPSLEWHSAALTKAYEALGRDSRKAWVWWNMPQPSKGRLQLADLIEDEPLGVRWHDPEATRKLIGMMSDVNQAKLAAAKGAGGKTVGTLYRRTRPDPTGAKRQRAEVRFDGTAGCLRTPAGGSSRQTILVVNGQDVRSRLLSPREVARLMGLSDQYKLPPRYNDAYHVAGDGVCVPVVQHLAQTLLEPVLNANKGVARRAA